MPIKIGSLERAKNDYESFVKKFESASKKTTDDCFTPPEIYSVIADYVHERFGVDYGDMVRPFYPGGDYENYSYKPNDVVVDNPPFSFYKKIIRFYVERGIKFFLFIPALQSLHGSLTQEYTTIFTNTRITYSNNALVNTGFATNMAGDIYVETCPDLKARIDAVTYKNKRRCVVRDYPDNVIYPSRLDYLAGNGQKIVFTKQETAYCRNLGDLAKAPFGGCLFISDDAAKRYRAAKDNADATKERQKVTLSATNLELIAELNKKSGSNAIPCEIGTKDL